MKQYMNTYFKKLTGKQDLYMPFQVFNSRLSCEFYNNSDFNSVNYYELESIHEHFILSITFIRFVC